MSKISELDLKQRFLTLFKTDAFNLNQRVSSRVKEAIEIFSLKRDREIFSEVFFSRYKEVSIHDLSYCSVELIETLNDFYQSADKLNWYLQTTQDMPNTIEDEVMRSLNALDKKYSQVELFVNAELSTHHLENEL